MFASFHPLLLHCAGNFAKRRGILWKLHLKSHLPPLTGLYSTLNGIKYFIVTCPVIDTELWLCLDKNCVLHTWMNVQYSADSFNLFSVVSQLLCLLQKKTEINWLFHIYVYVKLTSGSVLSTPYIILHVHQLVIINNSNAPFRVCFSKKSRSYFLYWQCSHFFICLYGLVCLL